MNLFHHLLLLATLLVAVQGDVYVSPSGNDTLGCGELESPCSTIAFAFGEAEQIDTINLLDGPFSGPGNTEILLGGDKVLTITTDDTTPVLVDCLGTSRWLSINATSLITVEGITVANCTTTARPGGAAIYSSSGSLTLISVIFINNKVQLAVDLDADGGAVFFDSPEGNLTVVSCTFTGNSALNTGINGDGYGGALLVDGAYSAVIIMSDFYNNRADTHGGAIYLASPIQGQPNVQMTDCFFYGNTAVSNGGAVFSDRASTVSDCTFEMNSAVQGGAWAIAQASTQTNCNYTANAAVDSGGGIYILNNARLTTSSGLFRLNSASVGGGIMGAFGARITANGDTLNANIARQSGGGLHGTDGNWALTGVIITANSSPRGGGINIEFRHRAVLVDCTVSSNTNDGDVNGQSSGIACADSTIDITNMVFENNKFYCSSFPVLTRCNTIGDSTWQDFCPGTDEEEGDGGKTSLLVGVILALVGLTVVAGLLIVGGMYMKKKKYWLWSEVTVDDE